MSYPYQDILERPHPYKTTTYRLGLMGLDEEGARRELGKRIEEIDKRLKDLGRSIKLQMKAIQSQVETIQKNRTVEPGI